MSYSLYNIWLWLPGLDAHTVLFLVPINWVTKSLCLWSRNQFIWNIITVFVNSAAKGSQKMHYNVYRNIILNRRVVINLKDKPSLGELSSQFGSGDVASFVHRLSWLPLPRNILGLVPFGAALDHLTIKHAETCLDANWSCVQNAAFQKTCSGLQERLISWRTSAKAAAKANRK